VTAAGLHRSSTSEDLAMGTRYRVKDETVRLEAKDGSASIVLELSRSGLERGRHGDPGVVRSSAARAVCVGRGRASSFSKAGGIAAGHQAEAAAGGLRRKVKRSD
jgi:hypothetical protein